MIPLRIACIGKHGQTAQALAGVAAGYPSIELHQAGREAADLTDAAALEAFIHQTQAHGARMPALQRPLTSGKRRGGG